MEKKRSSFSGRIGFVLSAAGSAVGLGNIWRFPYLVAQYGGGIFLLTYLVIAVTFGFSLMAAEIAIGRKTGLSVIGAYKKLDSRFGFLGWLATAVPVIIFPYYCVIGGWVLKYLFVFLTGNMVASTGDTFFTQFIQTTGEPIIWLLVFLALTTIVVFIGVEKGIESVSKVFMPILVLLSVFIAGYAITTPGAIEGVKYYFIPNFSQFSVKTALAAMGQIFYSMSLAMGIMITYGSYMKKENSIEKSVGQIEIFDTAIAIISGLMIVPAVFAFSGGDSATLNAGPGLMFVTLPKVFNSMKFGNVIGMVFFILVLVAALTSAISLMETVVSIVMDKAKVTRKKATIIVAVYSIIMALVSALGYSALKDINPFGMQFLDFFDFLSNSIIMPIVALATCILVGFFVKSNAIVDEIKGETGVFKREKLFVIMIKYIAPIFIILILITSILQAIGVLSI